MYDRRPVACYIETELLARTDQTITIRTTFHGDFPTEPVHHHLRLSSVSECPRDIFPNIEPMSIGDTLLLPADMRYFRPAYMTLEQWKADSRYAGEV